MSDAKEMTDEAKPKTQLERMLSYMPLPWTHEGHWAVSAKPESFHNFRSEDAANFFVMLGNAYHETMTRNAELAAECERLRLQIECAKVAAGWHPDDERSIADEVSYLRDKTRGTTESDLIAKLDKAKHDNAAAKAEVERLSQALDDNWVTHQQIVASQSQLAAARKTIEAMKGREGRLREELKKAQVIVCDATCPSTWLSIEGKPVCSDICRKITAALAATDGGVS